MSPQLKKQNGTRLITGHLTAGQQEQTPEIRDIIQGEFACFFSAFLSYKAMTHSAVVRVLLILPVKCSSLKLGTMPVKRRQMSASNKISSEKDVPRRVSSIGWASGLKVTVPSALWQCHVTGTREPLQRSTRDSSCINMGAQPVTVTQ